MKLLESYSYDIVDEFTKGDFIIKKYSFNLLKITVSKLIWEKTFWSI